MVAQPGRVNVLRVSFALRPREGLGVRAGAFGRVSALLSLTVLSCSRILSFLFEDLGFCMDLKPGFRRYGGFCSGLRNAQNRFHPISRDPDPLCFCFGNLH